MGLAIASARAAPAKQQPVDMAGVGQQPLRFLPDGRQLRDRQRGQRILEAGETLAAIIREHRFGRHARERSIDADEVAGLGAAFQPLGLARQRLGIRPCLADLGGDRLGVIAEVDAALIGRIGLRHLFRAVPQ